MLVLLLKKAYHRYLALTVFYSHKEDLLIKKNDLPCIPHKTGSPTLLCMECYELFFVLKKTQIKINPEVSAAIQDILVSADRF